MSVTLSIKSNMGKIHDESDTKLSPFLYPIPKTARVQARRADGLWIAFDKNFDLCQYEINAQ